jgi:putative Ca2+/H+ antiporter (TMEM165/GDT1 family)
LLIIALPGFAGAFLTIVVAIFIAELTDKDALLLLTLATRIKPLTVFAAGSLAFTTTSAIIVTVGFALSQFVPVFWIKIAGGLIMVFYAFFQYFSASPKKEKNGLEEEEQRFLSRTLSKTAWTAFLSAVSMLIILDLAGDATEVLTVVFVAHYQNLLLVFVSCVVALVGASAVETALGHRLGKILSVERIRIFSLIVFLIIGSIVILSSILNFSF